MRNEIINIKTDSATKKQAHRIAGSMGLSLSTLINGYLRQFIRNKSVYFSAEPQEIPSKWLEKSLARAKKDEEEGWVSPAFDSFEDSKAWLNNPKRRYVNGKTGSDR